MSIKAVCGHEGSGPLKAFVEFEFEESFWFSADRARKVAAALIAAADESEKMLADGRHKGVDAVEFDEDSEDWDDDYFDDEDDDFDDEVTEQEDE